MTSSSQQSAGFIREFYFSPSSSTTQIWPVPGEKILSRVSLIWDKQHTQEDEKKNYLHRHKHTSWVRSDYYKTQDKTQTRHVKRIRKPKKGPFLAALSQANCGVLRLPFSPGFPKTSQDETGNQETSSPHSPSSKASA